MPAREKLDMLNINDSCGEKVKSIAFFGGRAFLQHAHKQLSVTIMEVFPQNPREIAQIVGGQNVGSMHVKRSDPEKD